MNGILKQVQKYKIMINYSTCLILPDKIKRNFNSVMQHCTFFLSYKDPYKFNNLYFMVNVFRLITLTALSDCRPHTKKLNNKTCLKQNFGLHSFYS